MKDREERIYDKIIRLKTGTKEQINLAIKCEKILANESSEYTLEEKLNKIERIIKSINCGELITALFIWISKRSRER